MSMRPRRVQERRVRRGSASHRAADRRELPDRRRLAAEPAGMNAVEEGFWKIAERLGSGTPTQPVPEAWSGREIDLRQLAFAQRQNVPNRRSGAFRCSGRCSR
jgi:hypothetical protein